MINKKGQLGDQMMIFAFIFLLVIIGGGIVIGTFVFQASSEISHAVR